MKRLLHIVLPVWLTCLAPLAASASDSPGKAMLFFCRMGERIDRFTLRGVDTAYITLPDFRWRLALNNGEMGINATYTTWADVATPISINAHTTPSLELGFNAGFRSLGFGYSWDLMNAYSSNYNISLGNKMLGIEFMRTVTTNLEGHFEVNHSSSSSSSSSSLPTIERGDWRIAHTALTAWYALNGAHYSHNAAIKQSFLQKRTAGSLLLSVSYMSSSLSILDSLKYIQDDNMSTLIDGITGMITRQVAVGLGYGINYTPNHGKVLLHAAANMQVVCYSVNHISYLPPKGVYMPGEPQYVLRPETPVHITGNMRAAVSWEICPWAHLSARVQANHYRFSSKAGDLSYFQIRNWQWQAHLCIAFRFGIPKRRSQEVLAAVQPSPTIDVQATSSSIVQPSPASNPASGTNLPRWVTDFFFSPHH